MTIDEFLRVYPVRAPNLMWFLGAGASASAGIPTAVNLIWEFKRALFCAAQRISIKSCEDLASPVVQRRLDNYFQNLGTFPPTGSPEEYASYFEVAYPDPKDRRAKLDSWLSGAHPGYGHLALASLMKMDKVRAVWTLNFDRLVEDAAAQVFGSTSKFVVSTLDNSQIALQAINEGRWPVIAKMHGDFQSRHLKNTSEELRFQDAEVRRALIESCRRFGLIVVGYSGRDDSVMAALSEALDKGRGYPSGLFWLKRPDSPTLSSVSDLISTAHKLGTPAHLLEIETFDELLGDIVKQFSDVPAEIQSVLDRHGVRVTDIPPDPPGQSYPVIRTNALPLSSWPTMCRRIVCGIGGAKEVRETMTKQRARAVAARTRAGVLAFGSDAELKRAFAPFQISEFDCHAIEPRRLGFESAELGLLRDAFGLAVEASGPFHVRRTRSSHILLIDRSRAVDADLAGLRHCVNPLSGVIPKSNIQWCEALRLKLDYKLGRLWLLLDPTIHFDEPVAQEERYVAADFVRERLATRYNRQWNSFLEAWIDLIIGNQSNRHLNSFQIADGMDASFVVEKVTGFSSRRLPG